MNDESTFLGNGILATRKGPFNRMFNFKKLAVSEPILDFGEIGGLILERVEQYSSIRKSFMKKYVEPLSSPGSFRDIVSNTNTHHKSFIISQNSGRYLPTIR